MFVIAVIPMYFVALAYKHLTDAAPDAGTVFTWGSKAIGPHIGWIGGYALVLSSILAGVGAAGILTNAAAVLIGMDSSPVWFDVLVATTFILLTTWLVAKGAEESSRTTLTLTIIQYGGLALFAVIMLIAIFRGQQSPTAESFSWEWFNPLAIRDFHSLLGGFLVAIFIFWGFDASLAMSEETTGTPAQAGRSGVTAILITVVTYRIAAVEQLRTYAEIIDLPMQVVSSPREIHQAIDKLGSLDLILMDTAGRSARDEIKIRELKTFLSEAAADEVHLVLSSVASARTLEHTAERFASVGTTRLILTKLDEATGLGNLLPLVRASKLPLSYLTNGQNVPDDIEIANAGRAARLVLGMESAMGN